MNSALPVEHDVTHAHAALVEVWWGFGGGLVEVGGGLVEVCDEHLPRGEFAEPGL